MPAQYGEFVPYDPGRNGQGPACPPTIPEPAVPPEITVPPQQAAVGPDFCARLDSVADIMDSIGARIRDTSKAIDPDAVYTLIEAIYQRGALTSEGAHPPGALRDRIDAALGKIDLGGVLASWQSAAGLFRTVASDRYLNMLACRYLLQCLYDTAVSWGAAESTSKGRGTSLSAGASIGA